MATSDAAQRDLPDVEARVLDDFVAVTREAFGDDLVAIVLFGSAAEGALRATSDVNVIVILRAFELLAPTSLAGASGGALRPAPSGRLARERGQRRAEKHASTRGGAGAARPCVHELLGGVDRCLTSA